MTTITRTLAIQGFHSSLLVGVVLAEGAIAWGECRGLDVEATQQEVEAVIAPRLVGQTVTNFRHLAALVEGLQHEVSVEQASPAPTPSAGISRRDLLRGRLLPSPAEPETRRTLISQPLAAALRLGMQQALLAAIAATRHVSMSEVLLAEFGLSDPGRLPGLHLEQSDSSPASAAVASIGLDLKSGDEVRSLGAQAEQLQRRLRTLRASQDRRLRLSGEGPALHLRLHGSLGRLFEHDLGRVLGALVGLETTAAPCLLRVEEPLAERSHLGELASLLRMRRMRTQLVGGAEAASLAEVESLLSAGDNHMLRLVLPRFGSLPQVIEATAACRRAGIAVLWDAGSVGLTGARVLAQAALAAQPDLLLSPPDLGADGPALLYEEMQRTSFELGAS